MMEPDNDSKHRNKSLEEWLKSIKALSLQESYSEESCSIDVDGTVQTFSLSLC